MIQEIKRRKKGTSYELTCSVCSKTFLRYTSSFRRGVKLGMFCSIQCLGIARRVAKPVACTNCGKEVRRNPREMKGKQLFCSRDCHFAWKAAQMKPDTYPKQEGRHAHRIIAEQHLGRKLRKGEIVHHIDENKHNFDPSNLAVLPKQSVHARLHMGTLPTSELDRYRLIGGSL